VIGLVWSRICSFQFLLSDRVSDVAILAEVEIKAVFAFVSNANYRITLAPMTFYIFPYLLSGFHNQFNPMGWVMPSNLQLTLIILPCKVTILTHTKVNTIRADKTCPYNGSHVAAHTFVIIVSRKTVGKERQLDAAKLMTLADDVLVVELLYLIVFTIFFARAVFYGHF